jgi:hypothetical protein
MAEQTKFTAEFVDSLIPPKKGERWISDTEVRGFGIRLWGGATSGKSFAIRVKDKNKKTIRKTIFEASGGLLDIARTIALGRILALKDIKPPLSPEEKLQIKQRAKFKELLFDQLATHAIKKQRRTTKSLQYADDNWSRYSKYASSFLGKKKAVEVTADEMFAVLESKLIKNKPAQRRNLYSFFRYMMKMAWRMSPDFRVETIKFLDEKTIKSYRMKEPDQSIHDIKLRDFDKLFKILNSETKYRQKADFIHLLFLLGPEVSPSKLLQARTDEFFARECTIKENFFSTKTNIYRYVCWKPPFNRKKYFEYRLESTGIDLLEKILDRNEKEFPKKLFLFPSSRSPKSGHMTAFRGYWREIQPRTGLPDIPLKDLIGRYWRSINEIVPKNVQG